MLTKSFIYSFKRVARIFIDLSLFGLSLIIAYKLRLEHDVPSISQSWYWQTQLPFVISVVVILRTSFLFIFRVYKKMWRYTEINEILEIAKPIICSSLLLLIPRILGFSAHNHIFSIPISIIVIDSALGLILLSCARLLRKWQISTREIKKRKKNHTKKKKRTLLIGAGQAACELARKVLQHPELDIDIICALDDSERKQNIYIVNNIKVVGQIKSIAQIVDEHNIEQIIIAIPSLPPNQLREIIELCQSTNLETKIIPGVDQLADGKVTIEQIRKVSLEDLLGRELVDLSIPEVANFINNKTILITGAGGSIGSEITRQLIKNFSPKRLYLLGRGENSIFQLCQELTLIAKTPFTPIICDIRNYKHLYNHLDSIKPDLIFHAAAHKHVPLMEDHPQEAFENNVIGTKNLAEIAGLLNVETFVNISTDKAVNPINVLGSTKRLAELLVNSYAKENPKTKYISVRFGNVIGSRGSVIPIWEFQLKNRLPLTVTAKDTYRFFMTISESAQLVIKAGATGKTQDIMVLDMGEEVNIYKLAQDFIKLSGYDINQDLITLTGLRPGEKLKEELIGYYEGANSTKYKKILVIQSKELNTSIIKEVTNKLSNLSRDLTHITFKKDLIQEVKELNEIDAKVLSTATYK